MNRSILIVICDFLLLSLLAFSTVDINKVGESGAERPIRLDLGTNQADNGKDLSAVMRLALNEERRSRDQLVGELAQTRETAAQRQALLGEREKQVQAFQQQLQTREQESQKLQQQLQSREQETQRLQQQQSNLQQQFASAQTNIQSLSQQLVSSSTEAVLSKERLAAIQEELRKQAAQATALQQQLSQLVKSNQVVQNEKLQLAMQLQVTDAERRSATQQVAQVREDLKVEREEKAKLAEGVKVLASKSGELAKEVRENRPLAPNTIFTDFLSNRVAASFSASRPGVFGDATKNKETETVLVSDGTNDFALCHVQETPLTLWNPGTDWDGLTGSLSRNSAKLPIHSMVFSLRDPRVVLLPLSLAEVRQLGCKVYRVSSEPFKFQDAVLVGAREGYYGECKFEIDLTTPGYVRLDRSVLRGMFGKFNPSRGDLVFSRMGELLGVMANSTYCMMLDNFDGAARFQFGQDVRDQRTGSTLAQLYSMVSGLPVKLQ